ncbi:MAG: glycosyltransferase family 2 protein [Treponema sp.]|jgi:glycosyltransferase involved in cell wall biosynthesis|nr:glycosyltransferase family 2 protein [Treponema sp.]
MTDKLYIVIPAYNEELNIKAVAVEWHAVARKIGKESRLVIIDDGSRDSTFKLIAGLTKELPQLIALTKQNSGHGDTILYGYNYALEHGADFIFQTDSDGQTVPNEFWRFWEQRGKYDAIIGYRNQRKDGIARIVVTKLLKMLLWCIFGVRVVDANTPFRLMERGVLSKYLPKVPPHFNLSNVILTVCFVKYENPLFLPISFHQRRAGVNSINLKRIIKIGKRAVRDFWRIKKSL